MPDASAEEIAAQLSTARIEVTADEVRTVAAAEFDDEAGGIPHLPPPGTPSVSDLVRKQLEHGDPGESAVVAAVRRIRPDAKADSISRVYRRHRPKKTG